MARKYNWPNEPEPTWTPMRIVIVIAVIVFVAWALVTANADEPHHDPLHDAPPPGITFDAKVLRILDGDTIEATVNLPIVFKVRLLDCWAPETRTKDKAEKLRGQLAKAYLTQIIGSEPLRVHVPGRRRLEDMTSLGRVLGRAWITADGVPMSVDVSSRMVQAGHATATKQ